MSIRKVGCAFLKQKSEEQTQIILVIDSFNCFFKKLNVELAVQLHGNKLGVARQETGEISLFFGWSLRRRPQICCSAS